MKGCPFAGADDPAAAIRGSADTGIVECQEVLRRFYAAVNGRDVGLATLMLDDHAFFSSPAGTFTGRTAVAAHLSAQDKFEVLHVLTGMHGRPIRAGLVEVTVDIVSHALSHGTDNETVVCAARVRHGLLLHRRAWRLVSSVHLHELDPHRMRVSGRLSGEAAPRAGASTQSARC